MSAVKVDEKTQGLNNVIKFLGKRGKESQRWKQHEGNFWNIMFNPSLEIWNEKSGTCVIFRPYGSAAEDLKSEETGDVGDLEIMIFPFSDNLVLYDEMIEYLPENSLHVRIKAADHPLLRLCCVKDTGYLSTAALKNADKLIYGDLSNALPVAFQIISRETPSFTLPINCHLVNSISSPALKANFDLPAEGLNSIARQKFMIEWQQNSPFQVQENILHKHVSKEPKNGGARKEEEPNRGSSENQTESKGQLVPQKMELTPEDSAQSLEGAEENIEKRLENVRHEKAVEHLLKQLFRKENKEEEDLLQEQTLKENEIDTVPFWQNQVVAGIDFVPALKSQGWPKMAQEWATRQRKWPSCDIVDNIIQEGIHLVVKSPKNGGNPDFDFRISFSHAEYLLSLQMNDIQRECYRCFKKYHRTYLSGPKGLVTFHLKNILLKTIEETGTDIWTESNRSECLMKLFGSLREALTKRHLSHFFVRSYNLFSIDYIEDPEILESLAATVKRIMENTLEFGSKLIQNGRY